MVVNGYRRFVELRIVVSNKCVKILRCILPFLAIITGTKDFDFEFLRQFPHSFLLCFCRIASGPRSLICCSQAFEPLVSSN